MSTLHGLLAELGIEAPQQHPERAEDSVPARSEWIAEEVFVPVKGQAYELVMAELLADGMERHVVKRVRTDGADAATWLDLDTGAPLNPALRDVPIKAFRLID